jgi:hypothetical protein
MKCLRSSEYLKFREMESNHKKFNKLSSCFRFPCETKFQSKKSIGIILQNSIPNFIFVIAGGDLLILQASSLLAPESMETFLNWISTALLQEIVRNASQNYL